MQTTVQEEFTTSQSLTSPQDEFQRGKHDKFIDHEGKFLKEPSKVSLAIALVMSGLETGFAFWLLLEAGIILAITGATFPIALLWAMAFVHSEYVEVPTKLDNLKENYHDQLNLD